MDRDITVLRVEAGRAKVSPLVQAAERGDADNVPTERASVSLSQLDENTTMNTIDTFACRCSDCVGAACTCGCQAAPASQSGWGCGWGTGLACICGETGA
jgi:hypothetical protein